MSSYLVFHRKHTFEQIYLRLKHHYKKGMNILIQPPPGALLIKRPDGTAFLGFDHDFIHEINPNLKH